MSLAKQAHGIAQLIGGQVRRGNLLTEAEKRSVRITIATLKQALADRYDPAEVYHKAEKAA